MTIENSIANYQATHCETSFNEIYHYIYGGGKGLVTTFARRYKLDEHDVESMINFRIFKVLETFEGSAIKFRNAVSTAIKNGCIDLAQNRNYRENNLTEVMYEDEEGSVSELYEVIEVAPTTDSDLEIQVLKKRDQRQLITYLLSNANEQTLTSALAFTESDSYRSAAKQIGSTDKTVKSRIRNLSKRFDEKRFGNYRDYFTTATVYVG